MVALAPGGDLVPGERLGCSGEGGGTRAGAGARPWSPGVRAPPGPGGCHGDAGSAAQWRQSRPPARQPAPGSSSAGASYPSLRLSLPCQASPPPSDSRPSPPSHPPPPAPPAPPRRRPGEARARGRGGVGGRGGRGVRGVPASPECEPRGAGSRLPARAVRARGLPAPRSPGRHRAPRCKLRARAAASRASCGGAWWDPLGRASGCLPSERENLEMFTFARSGFLSYSVRMEWERSEG